jgi:hypothetical protein
MALVKRPTVLAANRQTTGDLGPCRNDEYNRPGMNQTVMLELATGSGTPVFSVQPYQSLDGVTWYGVGSAVSALGLSALTVQTPFFKVTIVSISGGGLNLNIC